MKLLLVEDNQDFGKSLIQALKKGACVVDWAKTGEKGICLAYLNTYDVILLDLYLPTYEGLEVAKKIREKKPSQAILVLSSDYNLIRKIEVLGVCDDYLLKPCEIEELLARVKALSRRGSVAHKAKITLGEFSIDLASLKFFRGGEEIRLRNKEFMLMEYFIKNPEVVLTRSMLLEKVWDMNVDPFTNTVDVHIRSLRKKINKDGDFDPIQTIPKMGYLFNSTDICR